MMMNCCSCVYLFALDGRDWLLIKVDQTTVRFWIERQRRNLIYNLPLKEWLFYCLSAKETLLGTNPTYQVRL